ncbi:hypothetical protein DPMN_116761 [Dreissena polymorpha]|uniref:Uncharacterized protein n=1 Tax=Dreissena polymorpha TaxID=45954 RepID=A0A9D4KPE1_DREPO|nr:hypothetical protein DPMN_116761 [Dreissena polymorpha]
MINLSSDNRLKNILTKVNNYSHRLKANKRASKAQSRSPEIQRLQPQDIIRTNVLTKFYEEVLTRINSLTPGGHIVNKKNALPNNGHVFQPTRTIFELIKDIMKTNLLTKKNALPHCGHVFQSTGTIFKLVQHIRTNDLTKFQ